MDDGEGYRDWEEEGRREGWSHGELEYQEIQEHQLEMEIKDETGYGTLQGWSTPPMEHPWILHLSTPHMPCPPKGVSTALSYPPLNTCLRASNWDLVPSNPSCINPTPIRHPSAT